MVSRSKRLASTANDESETKKKKVRNTVEDASDVENDNKHEKRKKSKQRTPMSNGRSNNKTEKTKANEESEQSDESDSEEEILSNVTKPTKTSHSKDKQKGKKKAGPSKVKAIISQRIHKGKPKFLIQWKADDSQTWESYQKTLAFCPNILREYLAAAKIRDEVEAIVSHQKGRAHVKYLIKWKDESRGETWEKSKTVVAICPKMVTAYERKLKEEQAKANEVEDILSHIKDENGSKYLIRWKDPTRADSWETARKAYAVCSDLVDKFNGKIPKTKLLVEEIVSHRPYKLSNKYLIKWKDNTREESWEYYQTVKAICPDLLHEYVAKAKSRDEVEGIIDHKKSDIHNNVKFLIKWKDRSRGQSWETETTALKLCRDIVRAYKRKVAEAKAEAEAKANEVEAITSHKLDKDEWKYLIKWKDDSRDETWETAKRTKSLCPDILDKYMEKLIGSGGDLKVDAILAHRRNSKGTTQYLIKWKDEAGSKSWESFQKTSSACPAIFHDYIAKIGSQVEAIVSHRRNKNYALNYLLKWSDHSKGETWESVKITSDICPQLLKEYNKKLEEEDLKANEVEDILSHTISKGRSRYLIKWKDHSRGETWEKAIRTIELCRNGDILEKFKKKYPQCVQYVPKKEREILKKKMAMEMEMKKKGIQKKKSNKPKVTIKSNSKKRSSKRNDGKRRVLYKEADDE